MVASVISAAIVVLVTIAGVAALWMIRDQFAIRSPLIGDQTAARTASPRWSGSSSRTPCSVVLLPLGVVLVGLAMKQGRAMGPLGAGWRSSSAASATAGSGCSAV